MANGNGKNVSGEILVPVIQFLHDWCKEKPRSRKWVIEEWLEADMLTIKVHEGGYISRCSPDMNLFSAKNNKKKLQDFLVDAARHAVARHAHAIKKLPENILLTPGE